MKIAHFRYTLECTHEAVANIAENDTTGAYHPGMSIICPKCKYQKRKIVNEEKSVSEVT